MEQSICQRMAELRLICDREIPIQQQRANKTMISFQNFLQSVRLNAEQASQNKVKNGELKVYIRQLEDDLVKALSVKTCKEAKHMAVIDSISAAKARTEELKYIVQDQKARKNQYAAIISQQLNSLSVLEGNVNKGIKHKENVKDAISWYNKVLGFQIEGGRGVKFIFNNINLQNPNEEFSFSIRHSEDIYTLLDCNPYSGDTKELIQELNQTNGLFKFVRIMREKFQATSLKGALSTHISPFSDSTTNSISAPAASISVDGSESSERDKESQFQPGEVYRPLKKVNHGRVGKSPILSPVAASSHRRSPRFKQASK